MSHAFTGNHCFIFMDQYIWLAVPFHLHLKGQFWSLIYLDFTATVHSSAGTNGHALMPATILYLRAFQTEVTAEQTMSQMDSQLQGAQTLHSLLMSQPGGLRAFFSFAVIISYN